MNKYKIGDKVTYEPKDATMFGEFVGKSGRVIGYAGTSNYRCDGDLAAEHFTPNERNLVPFVEPSVSEASIREALSNCAPEVEEEALIALRLKKSLKPVTEITIRVDESFESYEDFYKFVGEHDYRVVSIRQVDNSHLDYRDEAVIFENEYLRNA